MSVSRLPPLVLGLLILCPSIAFGGDSLADLSKKAIERSQITSPGSHPFVLKAKTIEITNPSNSDYQAEIEEYWIASDKWRRSVRTSRFSETIVVNGDKTTAQTTGDYYPNWLRTLVSAIFDPELPFTSVDLSRSNDNPVIGGTEICRRFTYLAGIAPVSNKVFSSFCFDNGLIDSVSLPGYDATYKNYKSFGGKKVAHTILEEIESGTTVEATIDELSELKSLDESQFALPEAAGTPLQTIKTGEATFRSLAASAPDIVWPKVRSGATKGTLSLYVCLDRQGHIRETYELNSSNPGLSDVVRDQVMKWRFKTAANHGVPVQVESILTFAFDTSIENPIPVLDEPEGSKYILQRVEPNWPAGFAPAGTPVVVTIGVAENGDSKGLVFAKWDEPDPQTILRKLALIERPLGQALKKWKFQPYICNGKATEYQVKVTLHVN